MGFNLEWGSILWNLLLVLLLVAINALFVAAEFALVKVRRTRLQELANEGNARARYSLIVTSRLDAYLSASQLGITLASLGLGWVGEPTISNLIVEPILAGFHLVNETVAHIISFVLSFGLITFFHIVFGEQAPKSLAIQRSEGTALWLSMPLVYFYKVFKPVIWLLNTASNRVLRMLGIELTNALEGHTEEEIRILLSESVKSGHIDKDEMVLVDNIFDFSDRIAREVMLPRTDMECLYTDMTFEENLEIVYKTKHTRYPVAVEDKDNIIGFVHITDMLTANPDEPLRLEQFLRPVPTVPESMEVSQVLRLMQKRRSQLVVVIDEYGGTAGLLTAEDLLEEIVGEMQDEFDEEERPEIEIKGKGVYSVDGRVLIEELSELLHLKIEDDEVDSIGGWLFKKLEGVPGIGKKVEASGCVFEVTEVDRLRVVRLNIYTAKPAAGPEALPAHPEYRL